MSCDPEHDSLRRAAPDSDVSSPRRQRLVVAAALGVVALLAVIDYATGPLLSMEIFYLVPVAWVTVVVGRRAGAVLAVASALVAVVSDVALRSKASDDSVMAANAFLMLVTLLVVVELIDRLRKQALRARRAEQQSREFLAFAAHQLRTPIAGIGATVDALTVTPDDTEQRDALLVRARSETTRAGRLMDSLLRVARLDQHESLPMRLVNVRSLLTNEVDRAARRKPGLSWTVDIDALSEPDMLCNPDALSEAVANLLDNAGRHALSTVRIAARRGSDRGMEILVIDDGPGLPAERADVAFERFVSLDGTGGSGLGLPIARGIAEAHGGSLNYEARAFIVRLPDQSSGRVPRARRFRRRPSPTMNRLAAIRVPGRGALNR
jgi:signal transduction histidine kinase